MFTEGPITQSNPSVNSVMRWSGLRVGTKQQLGSPPLAASADTSTFKHLHRCNINTHTPCPEPLLTHLGKSSANTFRRLGHSNSRTELLHVFQQIEGVHFISPIHRSTQAFRLRLLFTSLPLKKARSSIEDPVVSRATGPLV